MLNIEKICSDSKKASHSLALVETSQKNRFLLLLADWLVAHQDDIIKVNTLDIVNGEKSGLSSALVDRLTLTPKRIKGMASDLLHVVDLPDPVSEVFDEKATENGLHIEKRRVPLGVIAVIYESRPNVTVDVAALAIKSGNAIILRGGKETIRTNTVLVEGIHAALLSAGFDLNTVQFIDDSDRQYVETLLKMHTYVDMLIPRGGAGLHRYCREHSTIPVITGGIGICHLFVDKTADMMRSKDVIRNAKIQRPTVCNALDTVLVHHSIADKFVPELINFLKLDGVSFRLGERAMKTVKDPDNLPVSKAGEDDFDTEWLAFILGIKVVGGLEDAINHITVHSTNHSDGILTANKEHARKFTEQVDSAVVYVNASTRFTDGSQLGLGAEVAISTQRLHARGPMALRELTTYKWVVEGDYSIRD